MLRTHLKTIVAASVFVIGFAWFSSDPEHVNQMVDFVSTLIPKEEPVFPE